MAEIQYRCEVAEKKRARSAWERHQEEKRAALQRAAEETERKKQEEMKTLTADLTRKLKNEASLQREIAVSEALAVARVNSTILNNYLVFLEALCGVRATTAMHAGICFGFASFAHGGHRVRISCERQNYFFPFKILQLL